MEKAMSAVRAMLGGLLAAGAVASLAQSAMAADSRSDRRETVAAVLKLAAPANRFGTAVFSRLAGGAHQTVVLSPYSLGAALDMLALGAEGKTATLLAERGGQPAQSVDEQAALHRQLTEQSPGGVIIRSANSVWLRPNAPPLPDYAENLRETFKAQVKNIDFTKQASADEINGWVKDSTQGVIANVVDKLDPQTEFLLINSTYFKGQWAEWFDAADTRQAPFTRADGSTHDVAMMHASRHLQYAESAQWHAVTIPYRGDRFEMFLVTTKESGKSAEFRGELGNKEFLASLENVGWRDREVTLSIPRFRAEFGTDLTPALSELGLSAAFGPGADYPKITKERLAATTVVQRAVVEVSEEGTEAAAATTVTGTRSISQAVAFAADHPFFFGIIDRQTGIILFIGHVADPAV
jgi:serine protease inhibitor